MTTTEAPPPGAVDKTYRRRRLMSTFAAATFIMMLSSQFGFGFILLPGAGHFGVPTGQFLIWYSIFTLSSAVAFGPTGKLMAVYGVRIVALISSVVVIASFIGMAFVPNIVLFYALSVPLGAAWAGCTTLASNTLVIRWHQHARRGLVLGFVGASVGISGIVLGVIFPPIVASGGFQGGMFTLAGIAFVLAFLPAVLLARNPPLDAAPPAPETKQIAQPKSRGMSLGVGLIVAAAFMFAMEAAFTAIQPAAYAAAGVAATTAGLLVSFYSICSMLAKPTLGFLYDKLGLKALWVTLALLFVLGLPGIAAFGHLGIWVYVVLIPIIALSLSVTSVILPLLVGRVVPPERFSVSFGWAMSGIWLGLAIAVPLWGVIFDATGSYNLAMYLGGALGLVGLILCILGSREAARKRAVPDAAVAPTAAGL